MKKVFLHAKNRKNASWKKSDTTSKRAVLKSLAGIEKAASGPAAGRRINAHRIDPSNVYATRVAFNEQHFGCKKFYHQNGEKTWIVPVVKKETPAVSVKRIVQIIVPSDFFYVTDKTRKKTVCKRDECHRVRSTEEVTAHIIAHAENAAKEMLLKNGINKDAIMTGRNVCYVTLHKQVSEEKIREIFPTLHIRVFKVKNQV